HLLALIDDVLELSKIEAGRVELQPQNFDLHRMLLGLEEMFRLRAEDKGLVLMFDLAPDVPQYVRADEGKLRQVLINLLGNAVKFTQEGEIVASVQCIVDSEQQTAHYPLPLRSAPGTMVPTTIHFSVQDTGVGIAPEELDAVFDAFVQTASGQQAQRGTGLGMPISRQFVRLMGGDLTV
ncbi:MAG: hypothetical protein GY832_17125, partial [Chloroflexi bacterium]|nr:hypothetical protein [Chloroflexota bacterium]